MSTAEQTVAPAMRAGRGAIAAAVIGNWLEFFDFTVYGFSR
jgi:MHS family proline/betaine transporter-like MFS transporter